jgi:hypothetical protein
VKTLCVISILVHRIIIGSLPLKINTLKKVGALRSDVRKLKLKFKNSKVYEQFFNEFSKQFKFENSSNFMRRFLQMNPLQKTLHCLHKTNKPECFMQVNKTMRNISPKIACSLYPVSFCGFPLVNK